MPAAGGGLFLCGSSNHSLLTFFLRNENKNPTPAGLLAAALPLRAQAVDFNPVAGRLLEAAAAPEGRCFVVSDYAALAPAAPADQKQPQPLPDGWNQAVLTRDQAWLANCLADDYIQTSAGGEAPDKTHEMPAPRAPPAPRSARLDPVPRCAGCASSTPPRPSPQASSAPAAPTTPTSSAGRCAPFRPR